MCVCVCVSACEECFKQNISNSLQSLHKEN